MKRLLCDRVPEERRTILRLLLVLSLVAAWNETGLQAAEQVFPAARLAEVSRTTGVALDKNGTALELASGVLISDDGPAAGYSYRPNEEPLRPGVLLKKELVVDRPHASQAVLLVGPGGKLKATINGTSATLEPFGRAGNYWQQYLIDPALLKPGTNAIVLSGEGSVWIARSDDYPPSGDGETTLPNRSSRSLDDGKTWADEGLGKTGDVDGEYYVRLFLRQYVATGTIELPVVDLAGAADGEKAAAAGDRGIAPAIIALGRAEVECSSEEPEGTIFVRVRTGSTWRPDLKHWTAWTEWQRGRISVDQPTGRFLQAAVELRTEDPLWTPRLKEVCVRSQATRADTKLPRIELWKVPTLHRRSVPFQHERYDHPSLRQLRNTYQLDRVIEGANSDWERICRLAVWSSQRWTGLGHLSERYPPWDAMAILKPRVDGKPEGGFCQQANLVFLQACESLGYFGRAVSIGPGEFSDRIRGGHETVEIWSSEFSKWVYIDGNTAWYAKDRTTGIPLSLRDLRSRQLDLFKTGVAAEIEIVVLGPTRHEWKGLDSWPPFAELRMIPRSDFLARPNPVPLNQGMRGWFWTGHHVWTDERSPAALLYGHRETIESNWDWSVMETALHLEASPESGTLIVHADTEIPDFAAFDLIVDGQKTTKRVRSWPWKLHQGENVLEVCARPMSGNLGPASRVVLKVETH